MVTSGCMPQASHGGGYPEGGAAGDLVPQLAGLELALQNFYAPTAGPLGYDRSNGVRARLSSR